MKKLPQILTGKEVELLLSQPALTDVKGIRDKAMLEVMYATGIRVTELIDLNIDDVNLESFFEVAVRVIAPTLKPVIEKSSLIDAILSSLTDNSN